MLKFSCRQRCHLLRVLVPALLLSIPLVYPLHTTFLITTRNVARKYNTIYKKNGSEGHNGVIYSSSDDVTNILSSPTTVKDTTSSLLALSKLLHPPQNFRVEQMSTTDLAYIGDVVYELFIRCRTVWPPKRTSDLQKEVVNIVCAEYQSHLLQKLRRSGTSDLNDTTTTTSTTFILTNDEEVILSRGRNAHNARKQHKNPAAYQNSTAFEALLGYTYLTNITRCTELLEWIDQDGLVNV